MRGTVILWSGDKGVVAAAGQRFDFDIDHWQGDVAPAANMTVDVAIADGNLASLAPVSEADLAKESLAAMSGAGASHARAILDDIGRDVAIGYAVFFVLAMFASLVSADGFMGLRITLADLLSGDIARAALAGGSGRGVLLVLFATASAAVPYFWKHRLALLAFAVPLLFTALAFRPLYEQHRQRLEAMEAMGAFGQAMGEMAEQMGASAGGPLGNLGIGAWLLFATVIFLAFKGVARFLARQPAATSSSAS